MTTADIARLAFSPWIQKSELRPADYWLYDLLFAFVEFEVQKVLNEHWSTREVASAQTHTHTRARALTHTTTDA